MNTYTYVDYAKNRESIFVCEADSILEADKKLFEATGIEASKNSNIGCEPKELSSHNGPKMK
jgi:hypothetical protein